MLSDEIKMSYADWEHLIDQCIVGTNAERNRAIVKRRLLDGIHFESLAEEFDLSVRGVKYIVYKCQKRIISML